MPTEARPKRPHPGLSDFPCPPPVHIRTYIAHLGQFVIVIAYIFLDKIPDQDGGASPMKYVKTARVLMGFPLVPVLVHHAPSISARGRWGRPGRRDGYASRASHTCECSWPEGSPPYVVALRMSAMAEGWGEGEIKPGIAH